MKVRGVFRGTSRCEEDTRSDSIRYLLAALLKGLQITKVLLRGV